MPRAVKSDDASHRERQQRYRKRLAVERRPEASTIDVAVATAVAAFASAAARDPALHPQALQWILRCARRRLIDDGYDMEQVMRVLHRRMRRFG